MSTLKTRPSEAGTSAVRVVYHAPILSRIIVILLCAFLAFCTSIGPLYRAQGSISDFGISNAVIALLAFVVYYVIIVAITHVIRAHNNLDSKTVEEGLDGRINTALLTGTAHMHRWSSASVKKLVIALLSTAPWLRRIPTFKPVRALRRAWSWIEIKTALASHSRTGLFIFFLIAWAWVPLLLNVSFGSDLLSQKNEADNWFYQLTTGIAPSKDLFTQSDVYPIAHYLWPTVPTALTNQHNIVLTLLYGGVMRLSQKTLGTAAPGILLLGLAQYVFAAFSVASTTNRFFTVYGESVGGVSRRAKALTLLVLIVSPTISVSTISLTKSPLFAFATVWWMGIIFEALASKSKLKRSTEWELAAASLMMLISAKYGLYIIAAQLVVMLIAAHRQWKQWVACLAVVMAIFEIGLLSMVHSGIIMNGDPIEARALQIQQVARVAAYSPGLITGDVRKDLEPIFNLKTMGTMYYSQDADPVKSSGALGKPISYKYATVSAQDWKKFNAAWLKLGKAAPKEYMDAFFAEFYGYFDVADPPYVPMLYYTDTITVAEFFGSGYTDFPPRGAFLGFLRSWSNTPVVGWFFHGNFWVILTLLIMGAELLTRRNKDLLWQLPLLVQIAVMVASPANNFDRHTIGVAVMSAFVILCAITKTPERLEPNDKKRSTHERKV